MQIEEKIPVEVCKTTRKNEAGITLNRGQAVRKEGEKRRKPITKSKGKNNLCFRNTSKFYFIFQPKRS